MIAGSVARRSETAATASCRATNAGTERPCRLKQQFSHCSGQDPGIRGPMNQQQQTSNQTVRTRFAPSPTGYMHLGGMRTALFNWLWARHNDGQFVLRIDDTDQQRNIQEAIAPILEAFRWLELDWDEGPEVGGPYGPYFQSQRFELYRQAAERLLAEGKAFRDFDPPEVVRADREAARREKRPYLNVRRSLDLTPHQIEQYLEEGRPYVVRFLVPRNRTVAIDDVVRGHVEWDCSLIPDPVLLRADGSPLYNFATVVDDAHMRITHVIRAEEHLSNTPIQVLLHEALGNPLPQFVHVPYVAAPGSKEKLSKRKVDQYRNYPQFRKMFEQADEVFRRLGVPPDQIPDPVMVEYYQRMGYLPQALRNALVRLGWSLDDRTEFLSLQEAVAHFTLDRIVKSPAGFDPEKLMSYQVHWMGRLSLEQKVEGCLPFLQKAGYVEERPSERTRQFVGRLVQAMGDRLKLFSDVLSYDEFFVDDEQLQYDSKAVTKRLRKPPEAVALLTKFRDRLAQVEPFDAPTLEQELHRFVESEGVKVGQLIHALRVAVTGKSVGIGMFDCLELLGRERVLRRIDRALELVRTDSSE